MDIANVAGIGSSGSQGLTPSLGDNSMGKEDFLKLLVAQLGNQDPLQPMENTEFVSQLSQFSGLEQMMNVNKNLEVLQLAQASSANSQVAGLIGRNVEVRGGTLRHLRQGPDAINFQLEGDAKTVTAKVTDSEGNVLRTLEVGSRGQGVNTIGWDGKDSVGNTLPAGSYGLEIEAKGPNGEEIGASTSYSGVVSGVSFRDGTPMLEVAGSTVQVADIVAVRDIAAAK